MTSVADILSIDTAAAVLNKGLDLAVGLGLPVTTWRTGDPTRSLYEFLARILAGDDDDPADKGLSGIIRGYGQAAFLSLAEKEWLTVLAKEVYGVDRVLATAATGSVTLKNNAGGFYPRVAGDITLKSSQGVTYHTSSAGTLSAGAKVTFTIVADVVGSDGSAPPNAIDTIVTSGLVGVAIDSSSALVGADGQTDPELRRQCTSTLGALSPDGPADAYAYVCRNPLLTGVSDITRARAQGDSTDGRVTIAIAGAAGPVAPGSIAAAQAAVLKWAKPLCFTPTVVAATPVTIDVTATITGVGIPANYFGVISKALAAALSAFDISDGSEVVDTSLITTIMRSAVPQIVTIALSSPAAPVVLAVGAYPVLGGVSITPAA